MAPQVTPIPTPANAANGVDPTNRETTEKALQARERYRQERDKRVRGDGYAQYIEITQSDEFRNLADDIWADKAPRCSGATPAIVDGQHVGLLILGTGYGGLMAAARAVDAGYDVANIRMVDAAGGFGGTWYWNRYPGAMCDIESYIYMPLLEELDYMPKHKYSYSPELRAHAYKIAAKWNLEDKALFQTVVTDLTWDESSFEWIVNMRPATRDGDKKPIQVRAGIVISASGPLNYAKLPGILGIESFQGHSFHTSRWDYDYTGGSDEDDVPDLVKLQDKRVAVIGTGATAIQVVPEVAKWAKQLYVFQRTPSAVDIRGQRETHPTEWRLNIRNSPGWQRARRENFARFSSNVDPLPDANLVGDAWTYMQAYSALTGSPRTAGTLSVPEYIEYLHGIDYPRSENVRARVDRIIKDPETASKLKAWYPTWCKRPGFHDEYLPAFNRPNVKLVDTAGRGVDSIGKNSLRFDGVDYEVDLIIFATGFQPPIVGSPAARAHISVTGRNGRTLDQKWEEGVRTLHGVSAHGFPNLFWQGISQIGLTNNQTWMIEECCVNTAHIITTAAKKAATQGKVAFAVEATDEGERAYTKEILARSRLAAAPLAGCTPSYFNLEGEMDRITKLEDQAKAAQGAAWGLGIEDWSAWLARWRKETELDGLEVRF